MSLARMTKAPAALQALYARQERAAPTEPQDGYVSPDQLAEMLKHIPAEDFGSGSEPSWLDLAMSCHAASGGAGREEFLAWSAGDPNYQGLYDANGKRWDSFKERPGGITAALLYKELHKRGARDLASIRFTESGALDAEELENFGHVEPSSGIKHFGKAKSYSFAALEGEIGDLPPFLDGFFYGNAGGIYLVYGEPKSGKSLLVYSLCLAVAKGDREWMGKRLWLNGPVRWFALESPHSLVMSGKAWMKRTAEPHPDIRFSHDGQVFNDPKWLNELEMLCAECRLAVVDTFTMALPGQDQNSPEAASMLFSKLNEVGRRTGTTFIVIHHSTKADPRNARGSNAIIGNSDGSVAVLKEGAGEIRVEAQAVRYGPDGGELDVQIEQVVLGRDPQRDGQLISGPFLSPIQGEADAVPPPSPLDFIAELARTHGQPREDAFVLARSDIRKLTGKAEPSAVQVAFKRWTGPHVGNGYTMDIERADKNNAHLVIVRFTSLGDLSFEELSADGDMHGLI